MDNQLSGSIPASLGNLVNLSEYLDLSNNQLTGNIPSSLGNLVNLNYGLRLNTNQLSGNIPSSIGNLVNLGELNLSHNKLSGKIPSALANLQNLSALDLSYNNFTFSGMELIAKTFPDATYAPQAPILIHQHGKELSVSAGGVLTNNTYKWFRVTNTGNTIVATIKEDSVFHPLQNGIYRVRVRNSVATELILKSETIKYVAPPQFAASASSSKNALQQYSKIKSFFVYPNPAKDILHVQTSGKATLTLTDQSAKILFTKNINSKEEINVAHLPAGLYYLRNNETGEVQKVIIAR